MKRKGNVREETVLAIWLSRDDHPDHKAIWPKYGPTIHKNSFPGKDTLGKAEGNRAFLQLSKMHREP